MILFHAFWRVHLVCWFPRVVAFGVSFPLDQVLQGLRPSMMSVVDYPLHGVFFFAVDKVRWRPRVVRPVLRRFVIG